MEALKLNKVIIEALDKVCPEKTLKTKNSQPTWWTQDLYNRKAKLKALKNKWKKASSNPEVDENLVNEKHLEYQNMRKKFSKEIRKSKRDSWNSFTSNTVDIYSLNKIILKKQQNSISMMEGCKTGLETNNTLLDSHFPGSQPIDHQLIDDLEPSELQSQDLSLSEEERISTKDLCSNNFLDLHFLDPHRVREAFKDMNAWNSGGPDKLKSVVFQNLPFNMLERISNIYKGCVALKHTPTIWCEADIIFLAKPEKPRYDDASSFRPISKFNVILKGLEKLVKWELEKTSLKENPLHRNQHAYSRVKNVDTALAQVIDEVEKGLLRREFTLSVFIDIKGAFNNLKTEKALISMRKRGFPDHLVSWYESFVTNRVINSELLGSKVKRKLFLGTPQGGVLSPICWNVPFDELLAILNQCPGIKAIGFADDLVILANGIDESTITSLMQQALDKTLPWLEEYGLAISPSKSFAIMFTNKHKGKKFPIKFKNDVIPFKNEVKYLGVILDAKLSGKAHVQHKIGKAKRHLMAFHRAISIKFGPNPILTRRAYNTIVIPALTFGCHVFGDKCLQETTKKSLSSLNRLASLLIAPVAPSTPTSGLEIIYNLMPLDILMEKRASEIMARINNQIQTCWDGVGKGKKNSLIKRWRSNMNKICNNIIKTDKVSTRLVKEKNYKVHPPDNGRVKHKQVNGIISYTDGSVLKGKTGSGIHPVQGKIAIYNGNFYLGDTTTVFQAEVTAIRISAEQLQNKGLENQTITFFSDSQASLAALDKLTVQSDTVEKCINALNYLGRKNTIHLHWIKAHCNIHGNEIADFLAKRGTTMGYGTAGEILTPKVRQRNEINNFFNRKWSKSWESYKLARQTKIFFPTPDAKKSSKLLQLDRSSLGLMVQFLTGHNRLKRHANIQTNVTDLYSCRFCLEDEESSYHVIAECPALKPYRNVAFGNSSTLPNPMEWSITQVWNFLKISSIDTLLRHNYANDEN